MHMHRRQNGQEGFVPANYVKETAPAQVKKVTRKTELVNVPVMVKRKKIEKRYVFCVRICTTIDLLLDGVLLFTFPIRLGCTYMCICSAPFLSMQC